MVHYGIHLNSTRKQVEGVVYIADDGNKKKEKKIKNIAMRQNCVQGILNDKFSKEESTRKVSTSEQQYKNEMNSEGTRGKDLNSIGYIHI
jgi:hypothetical protein